MSLKDWQSLSTAIKAIEQFFKSPKRASRDQKLPDFFDIIFWRQSLSPLVADFKSLPAVFRFDEIKLKREQVNPDYEHLWLEFNGALYGQSHWSNLELRFASAIVQPGGFSRHPKVEIPKINGSAIRGGCSQRAKHPWHIGLDRIAIAKPQAIDSRIALGN
jgi:hypothetical protein